MPDEHRREYYQHSRGYYQGILSMCAIARG